jgi:hypothetical protein
MLYSKLEFNLETMNWISNLGNNKNIFVIPWILGYKNFPSGGAPPPRPSPSSPLPRGDGGGRPGRAPSSSPPLPYRGERRGWREEENDDFAKSPLDNFKTVRSDAF